MAYPISAVKASGAIDRWKRRAQRAHREPPPGVKLLPRHKLLPILLERDGPNCGCGCGKPIDPDNWEEEHTVPLESVKDLPDGQRAYYFSPANIRAFHPGHQRAKSAREAKARAHNARVAEAHQAHLGRMARKRETEE